MLEKNRETLEENNYIAVISEPFNVYVKYYKNLNDFQKEYLTTIHDDFGKTDRIEKLNPLTDIVVYELGGDEILRL